MDISTIDVYLDFRSQEKSVITLRQREKDSTQIRVILSDEGVDFLLNGYTPRLAGTKPNGESVLYDSISIVENTAIFMVDDWMTEEPGTLPLEIRVYDTDSNALKITGIFNAYITKSALDDNAVIKEPKYDALTESFKKVENVIDTSTKLNESLTELQDDLIDLQDDLTVLQGGLVVLETDLTKLKDETIAATYDANTAANLANEKAGLANTAASTANATNATVSQAESLRVNAENQRVENEKTRQDFYSAYSNLSSYSSSANYVIGNKVTYQGGTYQCIKNTVGNPPSYNTDNTYWKCVAAKGTDGAGGDMFKYIYDANGKNTDIFEYVDEEVAKRASAISYTATIGTTWNGNSAPYSQTIMVTGLTSSDTPIIDVVLSSTLATALAQEKAWQCVSRIVTSSNSITVYCNKTKPVTAIPIQLKVVR